MIQRLTLLLIFSVGAVLANPYTLAPTTVDGGGLRGTSAAYALDASLSPGLHGSSSSYTLRIGYAGQLLDASTLATGIDLTATPTTVNEGSTRQISAAVVYDDLSTTPLSPTEVAWSVQSGPLTGISSSGLATAGIVYQDTTAVVQGTYLTFIDSITLTVINSLPDNFGAYAGDQIDDDWQVLHFGLPPNSQAGPGADPDADGQSNLFEFIAGVVPTLTSSRLQISCLKVAGQPAQKQIAFSPRFSGRTYTVLSTTALAPANWQPLTGSLITDDGSLRTVTDTTATGPRRLYRVHITKP